MYFLFDKISQFHFSLISIVLVFLCSSREVQSQCFDDITFDNPGAFEFTIPAESANYIIEIETRGADGGNFIWGSNPSSAGGQGAIMKASYLIPASSELLILVGESGFNGTGSSAAGGGGGGSGVIINNNEVLIAAAGGGGGGFLDIGQGAFSNPNSIATGGEGIEGSGGGGFEEAGSNGNNGSGGEAGNLVGISNGGSGSQNAGSGGKGFGGGGGGFGDAGGGGGGYKGGDGGETFEGKGGDSFVNDLFSGSLISNTSGENGQGENLNGYVSIFCLPVTLVEIELVSATNPLCFNDLNGVIEVVGTMGVAPYTYSLNGGVFGSSNVFTGLSSGDYIVTVKDGLNNTSSINVTLNNPSLLVNTLIDITDNVCFGEFAGSIEVEGSGGTAPSGYSYSINGGSFQSSGLFLDLPSGFYVVSVIDDSGCEAQITADIISPPDLLVTTTNIEGVTCPGDSDGSASAFAIGGVGDYLFSIDDKDFDVFDSFSSLEVGLHTISVMDENGCIESISFSISEPDPIIILAEATLISCAGDSTGSITIMVSGGNSDYLYSLDGQNFDTIGLYNDLVAGIYSLTVSDVNGCLSYLDVEVTESEPLELITTSITPASCGENGEVVFDLLGAQGESIYSVDGTVGKSDTFNLPAGIYFATACDSTGCAASLQFEITQLSDLSIELISQIDVLCFGSSDGSVTVSSNGGEGDIKFSLDGGEEVISASFNDLEVGNYIISAIDSLGCTADILISIDGPNELSIEVENNIGIACFGDNNGEITLDIAGGTAPYDFIASNGNVIQDSSHINIADLVAGYINLVVIDSLGCVLEDTILIEENLPLQVSIDSVSSVNCAEGQMGYISLTASGGVGGYAFDQNGTQSEGVFTELLPGNYVITVEDSLGCMMSTEVNVGKVGSLIINGTGFSDVSCNGGGDGLYVLNISNSIGEISWLINGESNPDSNFTDLMAGQYTITAIDSFECFVEIEIEINQPNELFGEVEDYNSGNGTNGFITVVADGGTEPYLYSIDNKETFQDSATFSNLAIGEYIITIIDNNGCEVTISQLLSNTIDPILNDLIVSPNPTFDKLNISSSLIKDKRIDIAISNINGHISQFESIDFDGTKISIDVGGLERGTYVLKIISEETFITKRFIKM